ncbi:hypothetical protein DOTSEDRAFT_35458 [Dothistroma septosporum NZE10]|uniref:Uncharacterized protein n=1 Tax=Dothistroma septosporum (strain NZE10 / CBS 128990) TaxID=675120 RepID=M2XKV5_DOTSN|nr:hypothetical protein DOTSEDRAFT_35458 [Dothistroma septosporum NZE10]
MWSPHEGDPLEISMGRLGDVGPDTPFTSGFNSPCPESFPEDFDADKETSGPQAWIVNKLWPDFPTSMHPFVFEQKCRLAAENKYDTPAEDLEQVSMSKESLLLHRLRKAADDAGLSVDVEGHLENAVPGDALGNDLVPNDDLVPGDDLGGNESGVDTPEHLQQMFHDHLQEEMGSADKAVSVALAQAQVDLTTGELVLDCLRWIQRSIDKVDKSSPVTASYTFKDPRKADQAWSRDRGALVESEDQEGLEPVRW